jgi:23S rRNA (uracil1939-C5)-methyltransferase
MISLKKSSIYELVVEDIAYGGKGLSKIDGFVVFINNTVPGDIVDAKIIKKRKNYAEAEVVNFLRYSNHRIQPACTYSGICGGCKWQFLNYDQQLIYKRQHVLESLEHISLIKDIQVNPTIPSDNIFGYRNKMEFSCSDRRWLLPSEMGLDVESWFGLGLHVPGTFYKVLDISKCLLQPNSGNEILNDVRSFMKESDKLPYGLRDHGGFWRFLVIRHSVAHDQWMVNIVTANNDINTVKPLAELLTNKYTSIVSVVNSITSRKAGVANGEYKFNLVGEGKIRDKIGFYNFDISPDSFFQTNTKSAKKLYDIVSLYAALSGKELVLDLYCGTGTIAVYLSKMAKEVVGIEISESAILDAKNNCKLNDITNCHFILGDVKERLVDIHTNPDVVIIDPPRAGMHREVLMKILTMLPNRLIYVSCNPTTLARDILELKDVYEVEAIQPVDMFPHTFHVEVVAKLTKK